MIIKTENEVEFGNENKKTTINQEITIELNVEEIWDKLTPTDFEKLKEMFYNEFKDDYIEWLIDNGEVKEVE